MESSNLNAGMQSIKGSAIEAGRSAHGFFRATVAANPGMAVIIMVALIIVIIILIILIVVYSRRASSATTKSGYRSMGIRAHNPGLYNNARFGGQHAGMYGPMDSPTTSLQHAVIHPSQYRTDAVEQTHMHQGGDQEEIELSYTCRAPWDDSAKTEAQALVAVGGLNTGIIDGERQLQQMAGGEEISQPYSDEQLNSMLPYVDGGSGGYGSGGYGGGGYAGTGGYGGGGASGYSGY